MPVQPWGQESLTIRLNSGRVVTRPYREAISLVSRRLAVHLVAAQIAAGLETVPLEESQTEESQTEEPQTDPAEATSAEEQANAYESMKLEDLRELSRQRNLAVSGNKPDLIERLVADDDDMDLVGLSAEAPASGASAEDEPHEGSATDDGEN